MIDRNFKEQSAAPRVADLYKSFKSVAVGNNADTDTVTLTVLDDGDIVYWYDLRTFPKIPQQSSGTSIVINKRQIQFDISDNEKTVKPADPRWQKVRVVLHGTNPAPARYLFDLHVIKNNVNANVPIEWISNSPFAIADVDDPAFLIRNLYSHLIFDFHVLRSKSIPTVAFASVVSVTGGTTIR